MSATTAKKSPKKKSEKKSLKKRLVLLDAHAILHRAYHALPDFSSQKGEPTGALYGLSSMLIKIVEDLKPDYLIACYDLPEATFRHTVYEAYKAGRKEIDEALIQQIVRSRDVFEVFNIPIYEKGGFEADDMLGTIVEQTKKEKNLEVIIASGDMDTLQLVQGTRVQVYTQKKGIREMMLYDEKAVVERFGFKPTLLPDYKGLRGDPSDNIIGIVGIGEKTATELITNFGSIEQMYKALKKGDKGFLEKGIKPRIVSLLKEGEEEARFSKELATIRHDAPIEFTFPKQSWQEALDGEAVAELFRELSFRTLFERVKPLLGSIESEEVVEQEEGDVEVVDERELQEAAVMVWLLHSDTTMPKLDDILGFAGTKKFAEAKAYLEKELAKEAKLQTLYDTIEKPLIPIAERMRAWGVKVDKQKLLTLSKEYHKELDKLEKKIHKHAGSEFNVNSPRQLGKILYDDLALKPKLAKKTATGQRSTRESELEKMQDMHPIIADILAYRELQKLLSSYLDPLPSQLDANNRLHARFEQTGTTTGRMSSRDPNLQNIPIRTEQGRAIRGAFIAEEGFSLASLDYSQIELRLAAVLSRDKKLTEIFIEGGDVHTSVAAEVFKVPSENVTAEMRRRAKVINFGILYGMGVNALRVQLGTDRREAQEFLTHYFHTFSGLAQYLETVKGEARKNGYTETLFGRRRHFEGINSSLPMLKAQAERMAINAPIQGTQADIIKKAMVTIAAFLKKEKLEDEVRLLLQVHDELVFEIAKKKVNDIVPKLQAMMEQVLSKKETNNIPLKAEAKVGQNWEDMDTLK